jgi:type II secretory pathway component PulF
LLVVAMGGVVLVIMLSVMLPLMQLTSWVR